MDQRVEFIATVNAGHVSFAEACRRFGISRKTGYKWFGRYGQQGPQGLHELSRRPKSNPRSVSDEVAARLVWARQKHPRWGALKLVQWLERQGYDDLPAPSTANDLLKRRGLVKGRRRPELKSRGTELSAINAPNDVWCADYKGQFELGDRSWCYPLTVTDGFSRFALLCHGTAAIHTEPTMAAFEHLFRERGLPAAIRSDNGFPFSSPGAGGLSPLSVWWIKLGIALERIVPGRPQQNGRHERFHKTLREHTADQPAYDMAGQQRLFDDFLLEFNTDRPHEALGGRVPADLYRPALRPYPNKIENPSYPPHFLVRSVRHDGCMRWRGHTPFISRALVGEALGLEEIDDAIWLVRFGNVEVAVIDARGRSPKTKRLPIQRTVLGTVQDKLATLAPAASWTVPARRA